MCSDRGLGLGRRLMHWTVKYTQFLYKYKISIILMDTRDGCRSKTVLLG